MPKYIRTICSNQCLILRAPSFLSSRIRDQRIWLDESHYLDQRTSLFKYYDRVFMFDCSFVQSFVRRLHKRAIKREHAKADGAQKTDGVRCARSQYDRLVVMIVLSVVSMNAKSLIERSVVNGFKSSILPRKNLFHVIIQ